MEQEDWSRRLDGVFKRDDLRGVWPSPLSAGVVAVAARAFAEMLRERGASEPGVAVAYDARTGSEELSEAASAGVALGGGHPVALGLASSEQLYFACGRHPGRFQGGIMITASHNPAEYNGMKCVLAGGRPLTGGDLAELRRRMEALHAAEERCDLAGEFAEHLLELGGFAGAAPLTKPLKAVVAAGNGVGVAAFRPIAARLERLGFVFEYLDGEPDGRFPHGVPNPLLPEYMARLGEAVRRSGAQLGIGFDGDADRAGFVDETGAEVIPAQVYALVAQYKLSRLPQGAPRPVLMRNLCSSQLLKELFGGVAEVVDTPVGHGQIKQLMRHPRYCGRVLFAGEHSGHYFYPEFYSVDSGMLTSLCLLQVAREGVALSARLADWRARYRWSGEINWSLPSRERVFPAMQAVARHFEGRAGVVRQEVRVDSELGLARVFAAQGGYAPEALRFPDLKFIVDDGASGWWFVLRPSGNEPKLRLNVEAWGRDCAARCADLAEEVKALLKE